MNNYMQKIFLEDMFSSLEEDWMISYKSKTYKISSIEITMYFKRNHCLNKSKSYFYLDWNDEDILSGGLIVDKFCYIEGANGKYRFIRHNKVYWIIRQQSKWKLKV